MKFTNRKIWRITYPVMLSLILEYIIGLTDTAFLGRVGEVELGASALGGIFYMAVFMVAFGFSVGVQILIGRRNGEKQYKQIGPVFSQGLIFMLAVAAVMFALSCLFSRPILDGIIESEAVAAAAWDYVKWRSCGFFFSFIMVLFRAFYVGTTRTRILTINSIVMVLANVGLNYVLIFGKLGVPAMGIAGAAIASSVAEMVSVVFFVVYTLRKVDWRKYRLFTFRGVGFPLLGRILSVSGWTMIQSFLSVSVWFIFFLAVEHLGERQLAVTNIVRSVSAFGFMVVSSFASTASSLVSNQIGAGRDGEVMGLSRRIIWMSYLFVLPLMVLIAAFPSAIIRIYTDNADLVSASVPSLIVMISSYLIAIPGFVWFNVVSGTGNTRSALLIESIALAVYSAYVYIMVWTLKADVAVCWTAEHVYGVALLAICYAYMRRGGWKQKKI